MNGAANCTGGNCTCNEGYIGQDCCGCEVGYFKVGDICIGTGLNNIWKHIIGQCDHSIVVVVFFIVQTHVRLEFRAVLAECVCVIQVTLCQTVVDVMKTTIETPVTGSAKVGKDRHKTCLLFTCFHAIVKNI